MNWLERVRHQPTHVTVRRKRGRLVASARIGNPVSGMSRVNGYGLTQVGAMQNLFVNWMRLFPMGGGKPRIHILTAAQIGSVVSDALAAEVDADAISIGMRREEQFLVVVRRDGWIFVSAVQWRRASTTVKGRTFAYWRSRLLTVATRPIPQATIDELWQSGFYLRRQLLTDLARETLASAMPQANTSLRFGEMERWTEDRVIVAVPCGKRSMEPTLQVTLFRDGRAEIARLSYRVRESRQDRGHALVVPFLSAWTERTRHSLDLEALRSLPEPLPVLRSMFWDQINAALADPFVFEGHPLLSAPEAQVDSSIITAFTREIEDLVALTGPYEESPLHVGFSVRFMPSAQGIIHGLCRQLEPHRATIAAALETVIQAAPTLAPAGSFIQLEWDDRSYRFSDWGRVLSAPPILMPSAASAHQRIRALRRREAGQIPWLPPM